MKVITEERLEYIYSELYARHLGLPGIRYKLDLLKQLHKKCAELNPWQPIESALLGKKIRLFSKETGQIEATLYSEIDRSHFTHWQELPEDPK